MSLNEPLTDLAHLVERAAEELSKLGEQPLAIASARNKFNDAHQDDYWCSVQLGQYRWEQSQFFGSLGGVGNAKEFSTHLLSPEECGSAQSDPRDIKTGRELLKQLDKSNWHSLAEKATGLSMYSGILAVVIQFDQVWLHCSNPISEGDQIFALVSGRLRKLANVDDRFDELVGTAELIKCDNPDPDVVSRLSPAARSHFGREIQNEEASIELAEMLVQLALRIDDAIHVVHGTTRPFACRLGFSKVDDQKYHWDRSYRISYFGGVKFAIGETYFDRNYFNMLSHSASRIPKNAEMLEAIKGAPFEAVEELMKPIDETKIRRLFEATTGIDTFDDNEIYLLVADAKPYLLFRRTLYRIDLRGTAIAGALNELDDPFGPGSQEWLEKLGYIFATPIRQT